MRFNLTEDRWLPVVKLDGTRDEVSLVRLLAEAHVLRRIVGETPPMTAALHRLVLALAHRVYGPRDRDGWAELWNAEQFPTSDSSKDDRLSEYLKQWASRFELFDPEHPFFQCPAVAGVTASSAAKLVPYRSVGNNTTLFDHTTAQDELTLSPAEAARWLVTLQAYDPGGLKTPYRTEKSSQAAPGNRVGMVLVEGGNLKETLLLNMMPYLPGHNQPRMTQQQDRPVWEAGPPPPEPDDRYPLGWTDLLTWPSRRVWLAHRTAGAQTVVDKVVITPGTRLRGEPEDNEWMAAYQRPPVTRKGRRGSGTSGAPVTYGPWYPIRLRDIRGVWRHSQELLLAPVNHEERHQQRPGTLEHVADMAWREVIPEQAVYTLRVFGQQLDSKASVVQQVLEEAVAAPVALLRAEHPVTGPVIGHSVELADKVGGALVAMERDHRAELCATASSNLDLAYWPRLAEPFDVFLRSLARALEAGEGLSTAARVWASSVRRIAERAARQWADGSPRQGRNLELAGACYGRFTDQLRQFVDIYQGHLARFID